ncbi:8853_t:CDS:1, partial [Cetraspora pellucida]
ELETIINEISKNLIKDNNLFDENENKTKNKNKDEDEDNSFDLDNEKDKTNLNDLLITELIDLNFYDYNKIETNLSSNQQ